MEYLRGWAVGKITLRTGDRRAGGCHSDEGFLTGEF